MREALLPPSTAAVRRKEAVVTADLEEPIAMAVRTYLVAAAAAAVAVLPIRMAVAASTAVTVDADGEEAAAADEAGIARAVRAAYQHPAYYSNEAEGVVEGVVEEDCCCRHHRHPLGHPLGHHYSSEDCL